LASSDNTCVDRYTRKSIENQLVQRREELLYEVGRGSGLDDSPVVVTQNPVALRISTGDFEDLGRCPARNSDIHQ
jgi:hypothetical protein